MVHGVADDEKDGEINSEKNQSGIPFRSKIDRALRFWADLDPAEFRSASFIKLPDFCCIGFRASPINEVIARPPQGRRMLTRWYPKDLREEVRVPARHSATHGDAFFVVNLF